MSRNLALRPISVLILTLCGTAVFATTFIVPKDDVMVRKAEAIVQGTVISSYTRPGDFNIIETVTQVSINATLKGSVGDSIEIVEPGGVYEKRATEVHSSPGFAPGEDVVLFLTWNRGHWEVTDLALGAFHSRQALSRRLLLRSEDIEGWTQDGSPFRDKARGEDEFKEYIRDVVRGRKPVANYYVETDASAKGSKKIGGDSLHIVANTFAASTYTSNLLTAPNVGPWPSVVGERWREVIAGGDPAGTQAMSTGVTYFKVAAQNLTGAGDGGVSLIQNGLAAWNNDCGSTTNLIYGGTTGSSSGSDQINVVEFNDPLARITGLFSGSGTVAVTFSNFNGIVLINGEYWWCFSSADVVFQDGVTNSLAANPAVITHELGHSIGFRHSNATRNSGGGQTNTCNGVDEECTTTSNSAIMYFQVTGAGNGFTLQPWDINAVRAVYPGGSCVALASPTGVDAHATTATNVQISWNAVATATAYEVARQDVITGAYTTLNPGGSAGLVYNDNTVSVNKAFFYKVRAVAPSTGSYSTPDLATVVIYANPTLTPQVTVVTAQDLIDMRSAAQAVRTLANQGVFSFTDSTITPGVTVISAVHQSHLRFVVDTALSALAQPAIVYTNGTPTSGSVITAADMNDLRNGIR